MLKMGVGDTLYLVTSLQMNNPLVWFPGEMKICSHKVSQERCLLVGLKGLVPTSIDAKCLQSSVLLLLSCSFEYI